MPRSPYPLERPNDMPLEKYLLNLITAIVKKQGGEIRLTTSDILSATGFALSKCPSDKMDAIILRSSPAGTETYFVADAPAWTANPSPPRPSRNLQPPSSQPIQAHREEFIPKTQRSAQIDDLKAFLIEQENQERLADRQSKQDEAGRVEAGLYPWVTRQ